MCACVYVCVQARVPWLCERLQNIHFTPFPHATPTHTTPHTLTITVDCTPHTTHTPDTPNTTNTTDTTHTALLTLLRAIRFDENEVTEKQITLKLTHWPMTETGMAALQGLPTWARTLDLSEGCEWPLEPEAYRSLVSHIPVQCERVCLGKRIPPLRLYHIREGARESRAGRGLQAVRIEGMQALPGLHY